jgi:hypothetical protein
MNQQSLPGVLVRAAVVHTITYVAVGLVALTVFDYRTLFADEGMRNLMRPLSDPLVTAGPLFQPIRGLLLGVVFYLLRDQYLARPFGWVTMWVVLVVVGIFGTFGPALGSIEGLVYTTVPIRIQLGGGLLEVVVQSLLLSALTFYWVNHPERRWLTWLLGVVFVLLMALFAFALVAT